MTDLPSKPLSGYGSLLSQVKARIRQGQAKAILSANAELIRMYHEVGLMILRRQAGEGWGASVIPRLARDIRNELPEVKGFSERNIGYMIRFAREYPDVSILQQPVAKSTEPGLPDPDAATLLPAVPWGHHLLLIERVKDLPTRLWYMQQTIKNGWSRNVLLLMIQGHAHERQGKAVSNFKEQLPPDQSDLVSQALKDPYIFDFLTLQEPFHERELEIQLLQHLEKFLIELGQGFAFVGRQYRLDVSEDDEVSLDLLFYHLILRRFVVIDLKTGEFKPEYAGKMNFYLNLVDDRLRHKTDGESIGLILCQDRNRVVAEYALRGLQKPIGVSEYELTRALPKELESSLPTIEQIEAELEKQASDAPGAGETSRPTAKSRQAKKSQGSKRRQ